jgi:hypothetical protein
LSARPIELAGDRPPRRPWRGRAVGADRWVPAAATAAVVAGVIAVTLWQLHLNLLLSDTSTTGGDTGAHYMMPAFFSHLFPHLTGWDPGWYDGYPIYTFYFVLPDFLAFLASHVIGYNVAFKLATVLGSVLLPVAAWACGRLFGFRQPMPAVLAAVTLPYLFDYTWTIDGGNLFSTLAGEYAYSLSLALAVLFLGLFARGIRTGANRGWTALTLAACIVAHILPAVFAVGGAVLLILFELVPAPLELHDDPRPISFGRGRWTSGTDWRRRRGRIWWGVTTLALGGAVSGWWLVPFVLDQPYSTSMGYTNVTTYNHVLLNHDDWWVWVLAFVAIPVALLLRSRFGILFSILAGLSACGVAFDPLASLYNVRLLPLWFACIYLLAAWLFGVTVAGVARWYRRNRLAGWVIAVRNARGGAVPPRPESPRWAPGAVVGPVLALAGAMVVVVPPFIPWLHTPARGVTRLAKIGVHPGANTVSGWAAWNYSGYTGADKVGAGEYKAVNTLMTRVGHRYGCGRAMWEYNANQDRFGTPEALMLLQYWTHTCIDSMEGLLFESSTTTPFHFLNQAELSVGPSEAVVGLPYGPLDVPLGIEHLQLLGVRYFMAFSPQVVSAANADPTLRLVASTGPWKENYTGQELSTTWDVYLVRHSAVVTPLTHEPAVLTGVGPTQDSWLGKAGPDGQPPIDGPSVEWYDHPTRWQVALTAAGPAAWPRVTAAGSSHPPSVRVPGTVVSAIAQTDDSVSFHVSRVGVPVLVKISYFPNWRASGADGPWRAAPNLMVVVPTSHDVTLTYGTTPADDLGDACTLAAVVVLFALVVAARRRARRRPAHLGSGPPEGGGAGRHPGVEPVDAQFTDR